MGKSTANRMPSTNNPCPLFTSPRHTPLLEPYGCIDHVVVIFRSIRFLGGDCAWSYRHWFAGRGWLASVVVVVVVAATRSNLTSSSGPKRCSFREATNAIDTGRITRRAIVTSYTLFWRRGHEKYPRIPGLRDWTGWSGIPHGGHVGPWRCRDVAIDRF